MERNALILGERGGRPDILRRGEAGVNALDRLPIDGASRLTTTVESEQADPHGCAVLEPGFVLPGHKEASTFFQYLLQHLAAAPGANRLSRHESSAAGRPRLHGLPSFLRPVGHEVGVPRHPVPVNGPQLGQVCIPQHTPQFLISQEGRVPHDISGLRPLKLSAVLVEQGIVVLNVLQPFQHRGRPLAAVGAVPLEVTNPKGHAGKLGGKILNLDAQKLPGVNQRRYVEVTCPVLEGRQPDFMLKVK